MTPALMSSMMLSTFAECSGAHLFAFIAFMIRARASSSFGSPIGGSPLTLRSYSGPVSNDTVPVDVRQTIGSTDALRGDQIGSGGDAAAEVRKLTGGRGVDYVFVSVGAKAAFDQAYGMAARSGAIVFVGIPATGVFSSVDVGTIASDNQRILGSKMGGSRIRSDIPHLVSLWEQGKLKLEELISGRFPLAGINEAMAGVKKGTALRNVITF